MKVRTSLLLWLAAAVAAAGQTAPPSQKVAPNTKPAMGTAVGKTKGSAKQAAPKAATKAPAARAKASRPVAASAKKAPAPPRKRDPFLSPVVSSTEGGAGAPCETGKKCLAINEVVLRGIVKSQVGMIAVVENRRKVTYFLRDNDPVFNGFVVKITMDSVTFRENVIDTLGRVSTRDKVLKVNAPVV